MKQTVTGLFKTYDDARHAQAALLQRGFAATDIELPAHHEGVLAGIERLVTSFFSTTGDVRQTTAAQQGEMTPPPGETVRIGVRVDDEVRAELAAETLREEHALEIARRGSPWTWPAAGAAGAVGAAAGASGAASAVPGTPAEQREHSALDELGLGDIADAMRRRAAVPPSPSPIDETPLAATTPVVDTLNPVDPINEAEASVLTAASAPGAGAVMGAPHVETPVETRVAPDAGLHAASQPYVQPDAAPRVDVPAAPEATRPAQGVAPQIPNEFLEYEEDSSEHHEAAPEQPAGQPPRTFH
ncbi:hypothetical protein [Paraburkholderia sp. J41]|uniref:hypothetical protein n=1 Tax=Paraburkholderia sp. J41 TaxID=2805433 RepID=UPI002AC3384E|nr:hypothetical protein [Paraburkholderia sp. J41]